MKTFISFAKIVGVVAVIFFLGFLAAVMDNYEIERQTNQCVSSGGKVIKPMSGRHRTVIMCQYEG